MNGKRKPIQKQVQKMAVDITVSALIITAVIGLLAMVRIRNTAADSLVNQMEQNLSNITADKSELANKRLGVYADYISQSTMGIEMMYDYPELYIEHDVYPCDAANADILAMQRSFSTELVHYDFVRSELCLLGNMETLWYPIMDMNEDVISTVYLGTKSGFMLSYDRYSLLGVNEDGGETYYNYTTSEWYTSARVAAGTIFTDVYPDSFGRGQTISCAAPFYNGKSFAGVVCMDILVTDLQQQIIDVDLGEEAFAFLVDDNGRIIASPDVTQDQEEFESIYDENNAAYSVADKIMSGDKGITLSDDGIYYAYAPITVADWTFCISVPESMILEPAREINQSIFGTGLTYFFILIILIGISFLVVRKFSRRLTQPLMALQSDVEKISQGDLEWRATVQNNDELGDLAQSFNSMTESLNRYINDITTITAEKERIGAELDVATHIQKSMLPCIFPAYPDVKEIDIYATMDPAKEVGGDFYDFFLVDRTHLAIVMADVSGKGVPAALFMVIGKTLIKDHTTPGEDLGSVFSRVNNLLCESNSEGLFITAFEGVLDLVTGEFTFVNAGHEMPFISKNGGAFSPYKIRPGFVLAGMEDMKYRGGCIQLEEGDRIFQYTDGVTEATNAQNKLYGMDRLEAVLTKNKDLSPMELLPAVKADIDKFVGEAPQFDDITMLCLKFIKKAAPDTVSEAQPQES